MSISDADLGKSIQWRYYAVFLCILVVYILLAAFFYRETKGLALEESAILYDFDKKTARERIAAVFQEEESKAEVAHVERKMDDKLDMEE